MKDRETDMIASRRTPINDNYGCERTYAQLRVYSGAISPTAVTEFLGISPTDSIAIGQRKTLNSSGKSIIGRLNGWFLSSEFVVKSNDLRRHLDWLAIQLLPCADNIRLLQERPGVKMTVHCVWWSGGSAGPTLWPEQMRFLADLNLECAFEFADYGDDDQTSETTADIDGPGS
jgi:hypothetical protein